MQAELQDIASRLQGIIETAIDGIITIDADGLIETINSAAAIQFGYEQKEVVGQNIKILMPQPYKKEHDGYLKRYHETNEPRIIGIGREVIGQTKNGKTFPFRLAVSKVVLNDRVIFTGIIHDLTDVEMAKNELKQLNDQLERKIESRTLELEKAVNKLLSTNRLLEDREALLQQSLQKEKELNDMKSKFVSMASHEFRTPLSTIMSSASLISKYTESDQNENRLKHVNRIKNSVNNLTGILNDFLSLSKIEEGRVEIRIEEVNIYDLIIQVVEEVKPIQEAEQNIGFSCDKDFIIKTDPHILKNVLFNLVSNAIKYSGREGKIDIACNKSSDDMKISVSDNGMGIPEGEQQHLFERFFRASNVENIQGTGLGLSIVKRYVNMLNGSISFQSKQGSGTTFNITIPI